jgi:hypothetical protein
MFVKFVALEVFIEGKAISDLQPLNALEKLVTFDVLNAGTSES